VQQEHIRHRFCILGYKGPKHQKPEEDETNLLLIGLSSLDAEDDQFELRLFVDPHWRELVSEGDRIYIDALFEDFGERAVRDGESLFKQLCSLEAGSLVVIQVGSEISETPSILPMIEPLVEL
jgi:hypothetical protein